MQIFDQDYYFKQNTHVNRVQEIYNIWEGYILRYFQICKFLSSTVSYDVLYES